MINLAAKNPEKAKLWHPIKNGDLTPENVSYGSEKEVWWMCGYQHEWTAPINRKSGCPICNEQYQTSFPELTLRFFIKRIFPDAISGYALNEGRYKSVDLYIPSLNLVIEHDGYFYHKDHPERDTDKSRWLLDRGYRLIRVRQGNKNPLPPIEVEGMLISQYSYSANEYKLQCAIVEVINLIDSSFILNDEQKQLIKELDRTPFREYRMHILDQVIPVVKDRNILDVKPKLAAEWDYSKNLSYKPIHFRASSNLKVWWICRSGHSWDAVISSRTKEVDVGCPYCAGFLPTRETSLAAVRPDIAKRWDYKRNEPETPWDILPSSNKKFYWLCEDCGESYLVAPNLFVSNKQKGCSYCAGKKVNEKNNLAVLYPHLVEEWHESNSKTAYEVTAGSNYLARWKCRKCKHVWNAVVYSRTGEGAKNCSKCNPGGWRAKKLDYSSSLAAKLPEIAKQWDFERNTGTPADYRTGSHDEVWWKCENGHSWKARIYSRKKAFCKYCPRPERKK